VVHGGGIFSLHIRRSSENARWCLGGPVRKGEDLEDTTVKSDKVFPDQLIPGFQVVIEAEFKKGAELVVAVERKSLPVGDQYKQEVEQKLMVGKSAEKSIP
jgi:hypothetical protein